MNEYPEDEFNWSNDYQPKETKMNIIKNGIISLINWILWSSVNPEKISLTLKAGIPFLILFNIGPVEKFNPIIDAIVNLLVLAGTAITAGMAMFGAGRKLILTVAA